MMSTQKPNLTEAQRHGAVASSSACISPCLSTLGVASILCAVACGLSDRCASRRSQGTEHSSHIGLWSLFFCRKWQWTSTVFGSERLRHLPRQNGSLDVGDHEGDRSTNPFWSTSVSQQDLSEGGYHGAKWNDGDFYKWIEAVCAVQAVEHAIRIGTGAWTTSLR